MKKLLIQPADLFKEAPGFCKYLKYKRYIEFYIKRGDNKNRNEQLL
jgi:hypothetical protein